MKVPFYLITKKSGAVRTTKNSPALSWDEIAIKMEVNIPDELFKRPHLEAKIVIPEMKREPFKAEILDNIEDAIKQHTGYPVTVRLVEDDKDEPTK